MRPSTCWLRLVAAAVALAATMAAGVPIGMAAAAVPARGETPPTLLVAAASDLRFALEELASRFEARRDVRVRLTFGSSGQLASQIAQGAPFDLFFSANETFVLDLARAGLIRRDTVQLYAIGRIVTWTRADSPLDLAGGLSVLLNDRVRFVAIANPVHAPYGQAAVEALRSAGIHDRLGPRLVLGENVNQALQLAQTGNADAGIVALSLAIAPAVRATGRHWLIPSSLHRPIRQAVGVASGSHRPDLARAFVADVNGPEGRPIMRRYGFVLPGEAR